MKILSIFLSFTILLNALTVNAIAAPAKPGNVKCDTAGELMALNLPKEMFKPLCIYIKDNDPACARLDDDKKMNCNAGQAYNTAWSSSNIGEKIWECAKGAFTSVKDLGTFVVNVLLGIAAFPFKSVWNIGKFLMDPEYAAQVRAKDKKLTRAGAAFIKSSAMYFGREYPRNFAKTLNPYAALGLTLLKPIKDLIVSAVKELYSNMRAEFNCMNGPAKINSICKTVTDFLFPPAFVLAWVKTGALGLKSLLKSREMALKIQKANQKLAALNFRKGPIPAPKAAAPAAKPASLTVSSGGSRTSRSGVPLTRAAPAPKPVATPRPIARASVPVTKPKPQVAVAAEVSSGKWKNIDDVLKVDSIPVGEALVIKKLFQASPKNLQDQLLLKFQKQSAEQTAKDLEDLKDLSKINSCK